VSIVVANEPEASRLTGMAVTDVESARAAAQRLRDLGAGTGIVTLGEQGSVVAAAEGVTHVPAFPVAAVDSTAAGDTYCGCLVVALAEGRPLLDERLQRLIAGAVAEVDPRQIVVSRRLTPAQQFQQGRSMTELAEQVATYRLCQRQPELSETQARRVVRERGAWE